MMRCTRQRSRQRNEGRGVKVLVIENNPLAHAGLFGEWLRRARGAVLDTVTNESLPASAAGHDLVVTLGSPNGAWEDLPWVHAQRRFVRAALDAGTPVVGICFGAQLLATAIGGRAAPMGDRTFVGWHANDEVADPVWRGPWVRWHADHLEVPPGTEVLARDRGTVQAFHHRAASGASGVGVQFHPEVSVEAANGFALKTPDMLARAGTTPAEVARGGEAARAGLDAALDALFAEMLRRALRPAPVSA
jgi:GMP synthase (glutamine-hydrolysing)